MEAGLDFGAELTGGAEISGEGIEDEEGGVVAAAEGFLEAGDVEGEVEGEGFAAEAVAGTEDVGAGGVAAGGEEAGEDGIAIGVFGAGEEDVGGREAARGGGGVGPGDGGGDAGGDVGGEE